MTKFLIAAGWLSVVAVASLAVATPTISVGTRYLIPNQANQVITIAVTDSANAQVQGVNLFAQIGDGSAAGPSITSASLTASGSLFAADNTGNNALSLSANGKQVSVSTTTAGSAPDPVTGIIAPTYVNLSAVSAPFATLTINTTGFNYAAGVSYPLSLAAPGPTQFIASDALATTVSAGTLKVTLPGDADLSGTTNFSDLSTVLVNYNGTGGWIKGDFDNNNLINFSDLSTVLVNYNGTATLLSAPSPGLGASAVPEPSTYILFAAGGLGGWLLRRRVRRCV